MKTKDGRTVKILSREWMSRALNRKPKEPTQPKSDMAARINKQAAGEKKRRDARLLVSAILRDPPPVIPLIREWDKRFE